MRALIAAPFYPPHPGGIERYSAGVAGELRRRGWDVDVVHGVTAGEPDVGTGPSGERLHGLRSRMVAGRLPFPLPGRPNAAVLREVRRTPVDLVLVQSHLFLSGLLVARATGHGRRVWLNHGSGHVPTGGRATDRLVSAYEHLMAARLRRVVDAVAGVSDEAAGWLAHLGVTSAVSVGNAVGGVAPPRDGRRPGPLRVVFVGRLEPGKGAVEAIGLVDAAGPAPVELTVCGDGSLAPQVRRAAEAASTPVVTTGGVPHDQVLAQLSDADVFLVPSTYPEGFPTVLLEAGAVGCAVVTYPVGGSRELLAAGGGWRVAGPDEATARLRELAERPELATAAGEVLRRTVAATYTWPSVVDRLLRLGGVSE